MDVVFLAILAVFIIALAKGVYSHHEARGENGARHASVMMGLCGTIMMLLGLGASNGWNTWFTYGISLVLSACMVAIIGWLRTHHSVARHRVN